MLSSTSCQGRCIDDSRSQVLVGVLHNSELSQIMYICLFLWILTLLQLLQHWIGLAVHPQTACYLLVAFVMQDSLNALVLWMCL